MKIVQWLLSDDEKELIEKEDEHNQRAVYFVVKTCQPNAMNLLMRNGADVDPQTKRGRVTPLHKAVMKQHPECVMIFIENCCNVNLQVRAY